MSHEGPSKPINWEAIEEIASADNAAILTILERSGLDTQSVLDDEDFDAIRSGAMDAAATSREKRTTQELLKLSYTEYSKMLRRVGDEEMKNITNDALRDYVAFKTGRSISDEEIESLRASSLDVDEWLGERSKIRESQPDSVVALDGEDVVVATGATRAEAIRRAQEEQGSRER